MAENNKGPFPHGCIAVERIKHKDVKIIEELVTRASGRETIKKRYKVFFSLPMAVSTEWQNLFRDRNSMKYEAIPSESFEFSADGKDVNIEVSEKPTDKLLKVLRLYAVTANQAWQTILDSSHSKHEEEMDILKKLQESE